MLSGGFLLFPLTIGFSSMFSDSKSSAGLSLRGGHVDDSDSSAPTDQ